MLKKWAGGCTCVSNDMLRRPLVICSAAFAAGIACSQAVRSSVRNAVLLMLCAAAAAVLLFFFTRVCKKIENKEHIVKERAAGVLNSETAAGRKLKAAVFPVIVFLLLGMIRGEASFSRDSQFADEADTFTEISGMVIQAEKDRDDRLSMTVRTRKEDRGRFERMLVTISGYQGSAAELTGCGVKVRGVLSRPARASDPGTFDYSVYLRSKKILMTIKCNRKTLRVTHPPKGIMIAVSRISRSRENFEKSLMDHMDEDDAAMMCGILFGDDSYLKDSISDSFSENGIGHLLAASGLHIGFIYGILFLLLGRPSGPGLNSILILLLLGYAALAGFSPSVMRAFLMITVAIIGRIFFRRTDFLTNTALCAGILLVYEPAELFSSGFQLSFMAVISLAVFLPAADRIADRFFSSDEEDEGDDNAGDEKEKAAGAERDLEMIRGMDRFPDDDEVPLTEKIFRKLWSAASGTAALQLGMMPLTLKYFHFISIGGLLLNIPAAALAGAIVPAGIALFAVFTFMNTASAQLIPSWLCGSIYYIAEQPVKLLMKLDELFMDTGRTCIYLSAPLTGILIFYYLALLFFFSEAGIKLVKSCREHRTALVPVVLVFVVISSVSGLIYDHDRLSSDVVFVDVGQGDCAHFKADGADIIFDSGGSEFGNTGKNILMPYFLANGVKNIDLAVISHIHTDHYKGLTELKDYIGIKNLALSAVYYPKAERISEETGVPVSNMLFLERGDVFEYHGVRFTVLAPEHYSRMEKELMAEDEKEENRCCLVIKAEFKGHSFIFTGDIDSEFETELTERFSRNNSLKRILDADVLKIPHHGSRYSSDSRFLEAVSPEICVIQVGKNNYGHPTREAMDRMEAAGGRIYRNDLQGAVMMKLEDDILVWTMK